MSIDPMQSAHAALRCGAKSKRTGDPCRAPAVRGCRVCWMHGAGGGRPLMRGFGSGGGHTNPKSRRAPARSLWPQLNREIMLMSTAYDLAISASVSPAARRLIASLRWYSDSLGLRPNLTPFAIGVP